jgi:hypothetical protein
VKPRVGSSEVSGRDSGSGAGDVGGQGAAQEPQVGAGQDQHPGAKQPPLGGRSQQQQQQQSWKKQSQQQQQHPIGPWGPGVEDSSQGVLEGRIYDESLVSSYLVSMRVSKLCNNEELMNVEELSGRLLND